MTDEEKAEQYAQNLEKELMKEYEEHREYGQTPYLATIPTPHVKQAYLAGAKEKQQVIEKAVEIIRELGGIVREGVTCHYLVDYGALHRATLFLKEVAK